MKTKIVVLVMVCIMIVVGHHAGTPVLFAEETSTMSYQEKQLALKKEHTRLCAPMNKPQLMKTKGMQKGTFGKRGNLFKKNSVMFLSSSVLSDGLSFSPPASHRVR